MIYSDFRGIPNQITFVENQSEVVKFYGLEAMNLQDLGENESIKSVF